MISAQESRARTQSKNQAYYLISQNHPKILSKLALKKGDRVLSINNISIQNQKQFYQSLYKLLKNAKNFNIKLQRSGKQLLFSYKKTEQNNNKQKLDIFQKELKKPQIENKKPAPTKIKPSPPTIKKNLVPDKYKPYMQRAFVSSLNSFIYKAPDFDSLKLYSLPVGKKILISRKIFRPHHNFGSFYKIFLFGDQKIIGYISEAEVIPEFVKKDNNYSFNPNYSKAKKYKEKNKVLNLEEIESPAKNTQKIQIKKPFEGEIGLSTSFIKDSIYFDPKKQTLIGLHFSLHDLYFSPRLDAHLKSSIDLKSFYLELSAGYPILSNQSLVSLFALAGVDMYWENISTNSQPYYIFFDFGPSGALLAAIPINKQILFNLSGKAFYKIRKKSPAIKGSIGLQYRF